MNGKRVYMLTDEQAASLRRSGGMGIHGSDAIAALQQDVRCQTCRWWVPYRKQEQWGMCEPDGSVAQTLLIEDGEEHNLVVTRRSHACSQWEPKGTGQPTETLRNALPDLADTADGLKGLGIR